MPAAAAFQCPACNRKFNLKPELAGKSIRCKCGSKVKVPAAPANETDELVLDELSVLNELAAQEDAAAVSAPQPTYQPRPTPRSQKTSNPKGSSGLRLAPGWYKRSPVKLLLVALCLIFGPTLLIGMITYYNHAAAYDAASIKTTATVISDPTTREERRGKRTYTYFTFRIAYETPRGKMQTSMERAATVLPRGLDRSNPAAWKGKTFDIIVDPNNPTDFETRGGKVNLDVYILLTVGALLTLIGLAATARILLASPRGY
jgi:hypothetical protein